MKVRFGRAAAIAGAMSLAGGALALPAGAATFSHTGAEQAYTVPSGVSSVRITATGGAGGGRLSGLPGGRGATVSARVPVTPGQVLTWRLAEPAANRRAGSTVARTARPGAGSAYSAAVAPPTYARSPAPTRHRWTPVCWWQPEAADRPHRPPPAVMPVAPARRTATLVWPGARAPESSGGAGGSCGGAAEGCGNPGTLGNGGTGGSSGSGINTRTAGGGGGGLYGGGGGGATVTVGVGGGGGGSSLVPSGGTLGLAPSDAPPMVEITQENTPVPPPPPTPGSPPAEADCVGVLSAFVGQAGTRSQFAPLPGNATVSVLAREHGNFAHCLSVFNATVTP